MFKNLIRSIMSTGNGGSTTNNSANKKIVTSSSSNESAIKPSDQYVPETCNN